RISRRKFAVTERAAKRHPAHREPNDQQPKRRSKILRHPSRRQKNPDSDHLADDQHRRRPHSDLSSQFTQKKSVFFRVNPRPKTSLLPQTETRVVHPIQTRRPQSSPAAQSSTT